MVWGWCAAPDVCPVNEFEDTKKEEAVTLTFDTEKEAFIREMRSRAHAKRLEDAQTDRAANKPGHHVDYVAQLEKRAAAAAELQKQRKEDQEDASKGGHPEYEADLELEEQKVPHDYVPEETLYQDISGPFSQALDNRVRHFVDRPTAPPLALAPSPTPGEMPSSGGCPVTAALEQAVQNYEARKLARVASKGLDPHHAPISAIYRFGPQPTREMVTAPTPPLAPDAEPPVPTVHENDAHRHALGNLSLAEALTLHQKLAVSAPDALTADSESATKSTMHRTGELSNGVAIYYGTMDLAGTIYRGHVVCGRRQGEGTMTDPDGHEYSGMWNQDHRHGFGTMHYPNGDSYEGYWIHDKKDGQGVYTYTSGEVYRGLYTEGLRQGRGVMSYANGDRYEGHFLKDRKHGAGKFVDHESGQAWVGTWKEDQVVRVSKEGRCGAGCSC